MFFEDTVVSFYVQYQKMWTGLIFYEACRNYVLIFLMSSIFLSREFSFAVVGLNVNYPLFH